MKVKTIETERLILREFSLKDAAEVYDYAKNPNVGAPAGWKPHENIEESKLIIQEVFLKGYYCFAIVLRETGQVIGSIGFEKDNKRPNTNCVELGYAMSENFWDRGLMTEAVFIIIDYGFKRLKLDRISAYKSVENERSTRVLKKSGFVFEGTLRGAYKVYNGTIRDLDCFSITKQEFKKNKNERKPSYAYLVRCNDGSLYGGYTTDIEQRLEAHNSGKGAKYTRGRLPVELAYLEKFPVVSMGKKREAELKKLSKIQKEKLVKEFEKNK